MMNSNIELNMQKIGNQYFLSIIKVVFPDAKLLQRKGKSIIPIWTNAQCKILLIKALLKAQVDIGTNVLAAEGELT